MKTVFSSFAVDEKDFGKPIVFSPTGIIFEQPLGEKISKSNPIPNTLIIPGLTNVVGGTDILMGNPAGFLDVIVSGQIRKIPFY